MIKYRTICGRFPLDTASRFYRKDVCCDDAYYVYFPHAYLVRLNCGGRKICSDITYITQLVNPFPLSMRIHLPLSYIRARTAYVQTAEGRPETRTSTIERVQPQQEPTIKKAHIRQVQKKGKNTSQQPAHQQNSRQIPKTTTTNT